jgi:signal peptidase I
LAAIVIALVVKAFIGQAFSIPTPSMTPTLEVGDRVVVSRLSYRLHEPNRGDIVVFVSPEDPGPTGSLPGRLVDDLLEGIGLRAPDENDLIKRVIGLPGDTVEQINGVVYVNGKALRESYLARPRDNRDFGPEVVDEGHVFVMGDNRMNSNDSRYDLGQIPFGRIVGKAFVIIWPPGDIGSLGDPPVVAKQRGR